MVSTSGRRTIFFGSWPLSYLVDNHMRSSLFFQNSCAHTVGIILLSAPSGDFVGCPTPKRCSIPVGVNEVCMSD